MTSKLLIEIAAACGGGALLLAVLTFGTLKRVRFRRRLIRMLDDLDPEVRSSGILAAERHGFSWYVDALAGRALVETDPNVKAILAECFLRHPWEPGSDPRRELLDSWARRILAELKSTSPGSAADAREMIESEPSPQQTDAKIYIGGFSSPERIGISKNTSPPVEEPLFQPANNINEDESNLLEFEASPIVNVSQYPFEDKEYDDKEDKVEALEGVSAVAVPWLEPISEPQSSTAQFTGASSLPNRSESAAASDIVPDSFGESRFVPPDEFTDAAESFETTSHEVSSPGGDDRSDPIIVLVTGAAGPVGIIMINALKSLGYSVIAADSEPLGVGLSLGDEAGALPGADDRRFLPELLRLADRTGVQILIPTVLQEFIALVAVKDYLRDIFGLKVWLPSTYALDSSWDRWSFVQKARAGGFCVPSTGLGSWNDVDGPWVVKSRFSRGLDEVRSADNLDELKYAIARTPEAIVQHRLNGREFTADVLGQSDGNVLCAVLQSRLEARYSGTLGFETFSDSEVTKQIKDLLGAIGLDGPASVHGFIGQDGKVSFLGAKPTYSSGLSLCIAAGADMVGEYLRLIEGLPVRQDRLQYQPGVRMIRRFVDTFER